MVAERDYKRLWSRCVVLEILGVEHTVPIPLERAGVQGAVDTPDRWNDLFESLLEPLVIEWDLLGYGVDCGDGTRINHVLFADNFFLLADCWEDLVYKQSQTNDMIREANLKWKEESLQPLTVGTLPEEIFPLVTFSGPSIYVHKVVEKMEVLGTMIDMSGSSEVSMLHRRRIAEKAFWRNSKVLLKRGNHPAKLQAWSQTSTEMAIHDARSWHLTRGLLHDLRTWELKLFRRILRLRALPNLGEMNDRAAHNTRTATFTSFVPNTMSKWLPIKLWWLCTELLGRNSVPPFPIISILLLNLVSPRPRPPLPS